MDSGSSLMESPEAATRLPYTMPSVVEQETVGSELCDSSSTHYTSCLGLISPAIFISRAENRSYSKGTLAWGGRIPVSSASTNTSEEGYRSPAYTATLELLSPSTKLISKKVLGKSQSITRGLSSSNIHNKLIVRNYLLTFYIPCEGCMSLGIVAFLCSSYATENEQQLSNSME